MLSSNGDSSTSIQIYFTCRKNQYSHWTDTVASFWIWFCSLVSGFYKKPYKLKLDYVVEQPRISGSETISIYFWDLYLRNSPCCSYVEHAKFVRQISERDVRIMQCLLKCVFKCSGKKYLYISLSKASHRTKLDVHRVWNHVLLLISFVPCFKTWFLKLWAMQYLFGKMPFCKR